MRSLKTFLKLYIPLKIRKLFNGGNFSTKSLCLNSVASTTFKQTSTLDVCILQNVKSICCHAWLILIYWTINRWEKKTSISSLLWSFLFAVASEHGVMRMKKLWKMPSSHWSGVNLIFSPLSKGNFILFLLVFKDKKVGKKKKIFFPPSKTYFLRFFCGEIEKKTEKLLSDLFIFPE